MTDHRRYKSIKERYDLDVSRAVDPVRRRRRMVTWSACAAALLAGSVLLLGSHRAFEARPVSPAHRLFEQDCSACHKQPFGTLERLVARDNGKRTVEDTACQSCHGAKVTNDHHACRIQQGVTGHGAAACADCHHEHGDGDRLALVDDRHCTKCHGDLAHVIDAGAACGDESGRRFAAVINSFADHPPFALHANGTPTDPSRFEFNHRLHLDPRGLPTADAGKREILTCTSCHAPDASGEYMRAISFDNHCQRCHQLQVSETLSPVLVEGELASPLPHAAPEEIRGVLRGRLMNYAQAHPEVIEARRPADPLRPPLKEPPGSPPAEIRDWVESELKSTETRLLQRPKLANTADSAPDQQRNPDPKAMLEMMCSVCHETSALSPPHDALVGWKVESPGIPSRWLAHGRFPHNRHADMRCIDCHYRERPDGLQFPRIEESELQAYYEPSSTSGGALRATVYGSRSADDVLIPTIESCRHCHGDAALHGKTGGAPSGCASCHDYHPRPRGNIKLESVFEGLQTGTQRAAE